MNKRNLNIEERWKTIEGFPDYMISDHGRVRSITPRKGSNANVNDGILNGWVRRNRYSNPVAVLVALRKDGKTYEKRVHRLVLKAFIGPCPKDCEGCHNDGNPINNHFSNLRWDTHQSNMDDQYDHGTKTDPPIHMGESHHNTNLTKDNIIEIRSTPIKHGVKTKLAKKYNTTVTTINRIINRDVWRHV